jgi:hypothetical protein
LGSVGWLCILAIMFCYHSNIMVVYLLLSSH